MEIGEIKNKIEIQFLKELSSPIEVLIARGFIFESLGNNQYKYYFDRDHSRYTEGERTDYDDLFNLCESTKMGFFDTKTGVLSIENEGIDLIPILFTNDGRSFPVCEWDQGFDFYFEHPFYFNPVGVLELEPFVARYIKALHACEIRTDFCCDDYGFHNTVSRRDHKGHIIIRATGLLWKKWHKWVVEHYISTTIPLQWNDECTEIIFEREQVAEVYNNLQCAAGILFENRKKIVSIYNKASISDELDDCDDVEAVNRLIMIAERTQGQN